MANEDGPSEPSPPLEVAAEEAKKEAAPKLPRVDSIPVVTRADGTGARGRAGGAQTVGPRVRSASAPAAAIHCAPP